jgi:hypothetical protein
VDDLYVRRDDHQERGSGLIIVARQQCLLVRVVAFG